MIQSFAKNAGLYGERIGALHVVAPDQATAARVKSQLSVLARSEISNPPAHGARLVSPPYFCAVGDVRANTNIPVIAPPPGLF